MEATSFGNFCLAPPGWSDSPLPERDDCDALSIWKYWRHFRLWRHLDYSNHCAHESSTHQDEMEVINSFDNFCLAPPRWSDSSLPESDDCEALLLEALLSNLDTDTPVAETAPPRCFALPKSDNDAEWAKCHEVFLVESLSALKPCLQTSSSPMVAIV